MSTILEFIGLSPGGLNAIPALHPAKDQAAERAGRIVMDLVRKDLRPSQILTRAAFENAIASVAAMGGSTNGVLHLLAIARELDVPLAIDDFDAILERTPVIADMKLGRLSPPTSTRRAASASSPVSCSSATSSTATRSPSTAERSPRSPRARRRRRASRSCRRSTAR
jgi:dihydroxy-acid dehydratase